MTANGWALCDRIEDNIADIACVLGGGHDQWADLALLELAQWRARALLRNPWIKHED